jgi:hypothetical protein
MWRKYSILQRLHYWTLLTGAVLQTIGATTEKVIFSYISMPFFALSLTCIIIHLIREKKKKDKEEK